MHTSMRRPLPGRPGRKKQGALFLGLFLSLLFGASPGVHRITRRCHDLRCPHAEPRCKTPEPSLARPSPGASARQEVAIAAFIDHLASSDASAAGDALVIARQDMWSMHASGR